MRKLYGILTTLALCLVLLVPASARAAESFPATATGNTIVVSNSADEPDAHVVHPAVYTIGGYNYFKLRDVAMLLRGSERQFAVDYDDASKTVRLTTGAAYTAVGGELSGTAAERREAVASGNVFLIDGAAVELTAYVIDGANYFRLRDLGQALDFHVGYDDAIKTVYISGASGYDENGGADETAPAFTARYIRTNGYQDGVSYPVVTLIDSRDALDRYYETYRDLYDLSSRENAYADTGVGFADVIEAYDDAWFGTHQLLIVLLEEGSGSVRHTVTGISSDPEPVVEIVRLIPEIGTADMAEWHVLIETDRVFDPAAEFTVRFTAMEPQAVGDLKTGI